ncbi:MULTISPECIES: ABC transporter permease [unclassified Actinomyces]|uniref:ABC transporter permease n=1 Tax=unclassified Actinomyces TaxID=2609248 RepID=UPI0013A69CA6|nr:MULTISPECIES: ABC transporter permease [unclassified Actinomyces]MBW3068852.1 ABC transporter permease [Actinomyces sp. 594]NDR52598.1 ABC transporter permease [Actinomyces sp. 565]
MSKTNVRSRRSFWQEWDLIQAFGQRDLKSKFKGTALGWLWSLVVPLASLGIYTLIFGGLFKMVPATIASRHEGIGIFAVWLFAGLTIWGFFQNSINAGINGLLGSGGLLQKVYFPAYSAVLGSCLAVGVQSGIEVGLLLVVLACLTNVSWTWLLLVPFLLLLTVFTGAVSVILSVWNIYVRDLAHLVGVFLQLMFYATPIIYNPDIVPQTVWGLPAHDLIQGMPMAQFISLFRSLVYSLQPGAAASWLACAAWAALALVAAVWVSRRWGADLGERI